MNRYSPFLMPFLFKRTILVSLVSLTRWAPSIHASGMTPFSSSINLLIDYSTTSEVSSSLFLMFFTRRQRPLLFCSLSSQHESNCWQYTFTWSCRTEFSRFKFDTCCWPSRQILVPKTCWGRPPQTSPGRPLKVLPDRPREVPIWSPRDVPNWRPGDVLRWRPGDVLIWSSRDVPGRLIQDVPRTSPIGSWEYSNLDVEFFFKLFFQNLFDWPNLKVFQHSRCIENPVKLLRWSIFCKIS